RVPRYTRLTGPERDRRRHRVAIAYVHERATVDAIARTTGRSYGMVYRLLAEAEVPMRPVGFKQMKMERESKTA
ncbi:MAG TPA: helix-turn-helix domain-containing protein, partial [Streptomyces sp.]|nr:helix-turn-helix domain-containing protein [Streptomyces sp.]